MIFWASFSSLPIPWNTSSLHPLQRRAVMNARKFLPVITKQLTKRKLPKLVMYVRRRWLIVHHDQLNYFFHEYHKMLLNRWRNRWMKLCVISKFLGYQSKLSSILSMCSRIKVLDRFHWCFEKKPRCKLCQFTTEVEAKPGWIASKPRSLIDKDLLLSIS